MTQPFPPLKRAYGIGRTAQWNRPPGRPYPADRTFRWMCANVDQKLPAYRSEGELHRIKLYRRKWLDSVTVDNDGCWIWMGSSAHVGRSPLICIDKRQIGAFPWMIDQWFPELKNQLQFGEIRASYATCGKQLCVRPQCRRGGQQNHDHGYLRKIGVRTMTPDMVRQVRKLLEDHTQKSVAMIMNVPLHRVNDIRRRQAYAWVTEDPANDPPLEAIYGLRPCEGYSGVGPGVPSPENGSEGAE